MPETLKTFITSQLTNTGKEAGINTDTAQNFSTTFTVIGLVLYLFIVLVGFLFFIQLILGGLQWITSGGNEEKVKKATHRISNAAIGIAIFLAAYLITTYLFQYLSQNFCFTAGGFQ